jgi:hypothetical protein
MTFRPRWDTPVLSVDDQVDHVRLEAEAERLTGTDAERLSWRLALDIVLFLRRHPEANWDTVRDAMDRVSDLVRNARNRNRACHWTPRRKTPPK